MHLSGTILDEENTQFASTRNAKILFFCNQLINIASNPMVKVTSDVINYGLRGENTRKFN